MRADFKFIKLFRFQILSEYDSKKGQQSNLILSNIRLNVRVITFNLHLTLRIINLRIKSFKFL
jgi:hypothetical protein